MQIRVKLFAILRERAGTGELELEVPQSATVATAAELLAANLPQIRDPLRRAAFAINQTYAPTDSALKDGDELAIIPPVSGG